MKGIRETFKKIDPFRNKGIKLFFINLLKKFFKDQLLVRIDKSERVDINFGDVKKILIVRQHNQLGDMLCAVPLLRAIRQRFRNAKVTLITSPVNYEVVKDNPFVDEVLNFDKVKFFISPSRIFEFVRKLKSGFDIAIVPVTVSISTTSNLLAYFSNARVRIGPASLDGKENPTAFLFNYQVDLDWRSEEKKHQTERNLDIVRPFGIDTDDLSYVIPYFDEDREFAEKILSIGGDFKFVIGYHPGAGKVKNRWSADNFAELALKLANKFNAFTLITAGPMDDEPVERMKKQIDGKIEYLILRNERISRIVAVIDKIDLFITNDTGIMHVAGATSTPVISLFGSTNPYQWSPLNKDKFFIWSRTGDINDIKIEEVYKLAVEILSRKSKSA
ncbi:heptosyltransferase-2 [Candidatus Kryptobacter tengchongensis]|uniref:Heptosyltransferase-2 n=1 Tax=Kryptobacter tengchongensis TaxID=1643429 RepID=A0A656DHL9_KRYT1|nr:glycosyltransferase family 9 protein [Candidatus Kryptobacter tengchongensis]CUS97215.1 heptosyltransferase-2 [Candidatus Kryptobacter tengchongensis]CUU10010.1 heptosyltransferase-2 [Candidatus Kryptobacter tengchongensis]